MKGKPNCNECGGKGEIMLLTTFVPCDCVEVDETITSPVDPMAGLFPGENRVIQNDRSWELTDRLNFPPFPPGHPGYDAQQNWESKKAALN